MNRYRIILISRGENKKANYTDSLPLGEERQLSSQFPQVPLIWLPASSTSVEHQGLYLVNCFMTSVHELWTLPTNLKGNLQGCPLPGPSIAKQFDDEPL